jgi:hypothetical protein
MNGFFCAYKYYKYYFLKSKIYVNNNVYVQHTCNLLFLCISLNNISSNDT